MFSLPPFAWTMTSRRATLQRLRRSNRDPHPAATAIWYATLRPPMTDAARSSHLHSAACMTELQVELTPLVEEHAPHLNVRQVLRVRPFRLLWCSQLLSQVAGHVLNFALVIRVYEITGSNALVSVLVALISIPPILFSSLAGVYADNFNRKYILFGSSVVRCGVAIALLAVGNQASALIGIAFVIATVSQFFGPAESSSIASLVPRRGYFSANSLFVFTTYTAFLVGYSLAGPALSFLGEERTFTVLTLMFAAAAVCNLLLPPLNDHLMHAKNRSLVHRAFGSLRTDMREGLRFLHGNRLLLMIVLLASAIFSFERAIISLLPDLAQRTFAYSLDEISYFIITPAGVGAFLGALLANRLKLHVEKTKIIILGMLIAGVTLMLFPLSGAADLLLDGRTDLVTFVGTLAFLSGLGDVFIIIAAQTVIHEQTTAATRGRVFGALITIMNAVGLPLILLVGFLADRFPVVDIIFVIGAIITGLVALSTMQFRQLARAVG